MQKGNFFTETKTWPLFEMEEVYTVYYVFVSVTSLVLPRVAEFRGE